MGNIGCLLPCHMTLKWVYCQWDKMVALVINPWIPIINIILFIIDQRARERKTTFELKNCLIKNCLGAIRWVCIFLIILVNLPAAWFNKNGYSLDDYCLIIMCRHQRMYGDVFISPEYLVLEFYHVYSIKWKKDLLFQHHFPLVLHLCLSWAALGIPWDPLWSMSFLKLPQ